MHVSVALSAILIEVAATGGGAAALPVSCGLVSPSSVSLHRKHPDWPQLKEVCRTLHHQSRSSLEGCLGTGLLSGSLMCRFHPGGDRVICWGTKLVREEPGLMPLSEVALFCEVL